jgi:hypothetical protein
MKRLFVEGYLHLLMVEWQMSFLKLSTLHRRVRTANVSIPRSGLLYSARDICHAVDLACVLYPKRVYCLQRAAATTLLLRRHGLCAEMVIGAQMLPLWSHAWVELEGVVINDKPYMRTIYRVLERC